MNFGDPIHLSIEFVLGNLIGVLIGFPLHEYAHGRMAIYLGDNTPYFQGRLTLDPRAHVDPIGLIFAIIFGFGWTRPIPLNAWALRPDRKRGTILVAIAGPLANLGLAIVFGIVLSLAWAIGFPAFIILILIATVRFNLVMFFYNIVPLHPLDGWRILLSAVNDRQEFELKEYEQYTIYALMILLLTGILGSFFSPYIGAFIDIFI